MTKVALESSFNTKTHFHAKITSKPFSPFQFLNFSSTQDFNKNSMFENTALLEKKLDLNPEKGTIDSKNKMMGKMNTPVLYRSI